MKKSTILIIAFPLIFKIAFAQPIPEVNPSRIGLTPAGIKSLDSLMERYTQSDRFPCAMLMVTRNGEIGYWKAFGVRDLETKTKLDRNDVFRIYSMTKTITAVAILQLWEQGKIGLDDPVEKYIPSFSNLKVLDEKGYHVPKSKMTIRHLLNFSSGLTYGMLNQKTRADTLMSKANLFEKATNLADLVERISVLPLVNDPGETVTYGFQTDILGRIIEIASRNSLDKYFQDNIFKPLGMNETGFQIPGNLLNRFPVLYNISSNGVPAIADANDMTSDYFKDLDKRSSTRFLSGGGGLLSTPADYIRFARMLANKGELNGRLILKSTTVEMMTIPNYTKDIERHISIFGHGWLPGFQVQVAPDITATTCGGHNGLYWIAGAANLFFWVDPVTNIVAMVWAQSLPFMVYPIFDDTRKAVHQAFNDAKPLN